MERRDVIAVGEEMGSWMDGLDVEVAGVVPGIDDVVGVEDGAFDPVVGALGDFGHAAVVERGDDDAVGHVVGVDGTGNGLDEARVALDAVLELDVEAEGGVGEQVKDLVEEGDLGAWMVGVGGRVEGTDLVKGHGDDWAVSVGGAIDGFVMTDDDVAVAGELDVEFNAVGVEVDGVLKGGKGVFRELHAGAAVGPHGGHEVMMPRALTGVPAPVRWMAWS